LVPVPLAPEPGRLRSVWTLLQRAPIVVGIAVAPLHLLDHVVDAN